MCLQIRISADAGGVRGPNAGPSREAVGRRSCRSLAWLRAVHRGQPRKSGRTHRKSPCDEATSFAHVGRQFLVFYLVRVGHSTSDMLGKSAESREIHAPKAEDGITLRANRPASAGRLPPVCIPLGAPREEKHRHRKKHWCSPRAAQASAARPRRPPTMQGPALQGRV